MKKAKIFSAFLNGTATQVKAYQKKNALEWLNKQPGGDQIKMRNLKELKGVVNSHQTPVDAA